MRLEAKCTMTLDVDNPRAGCDAAARSGEGQWVVSETTSWSLSFHRRYTDPYGTCAKPHDTTGSFKVGVTAQVRRGHIPWPPASAHAAESGAADALQYLLAVATPVRYRRTKPQRWLRARRDTTRSRLPALHPHPDRIQIRRQQRLD